MPKGYLMANLRVKDQDTFKEFSSVALPLIESFGGKLLARGPHADRHEGEVSGIVTLIEFESKEAAEKFYFSEEYQAAKAIRDRGVDTDLMIIEGMWATDEFYKLFATKEFKISIKIKRKSKIAVGLEKELLEINENECSGHCLDGWANLDKYSCARCCNGKTIDI